MRPCYTCQSYRRWLRSSGVSRWRTWFRLCWTHHMQRHARLYIAGRLALLGCLALAAAGLGILVQLVRLGLDGGP